MTGKTERTVKATATISAADLMRAITNALLAASKDDTLPALTSVHFRPGSKPGTLLLEATDRYRLSQEDIDLAILEAFDSDWSPADVEKHMIAAHGHVKPDHQYGVPSDIEAKHAAAHVADRTTDHAHTVRPVAETELDCLVDSRDLGKLVRTLKLVIEPETKNATGLQAPHVVIEHLAAGQSWDDKVAFTLVNNNGSETTVTYKAVGGEFPNTEYLTSGALEQARRNEELLHSESAGHIASDDTHDALAQIATGYCFNPEYLAAFCKVDTGNRHDTVDMVFTGKDKAVIFTVGERYRALLVPIRKAVQ